MTVADRAVRTILRASGVRSRHVETGVARHHVYDAAGRGALPTLVLLPGLCDSGASHAPLVWRVRRDFRRVLVVESAGHGLSGAARGTYTIERHLASVAEVLDALLDEPAIVAGNSLGGATALSYAATRPGMVRALYLTSPAGGALDHDATDLRQRFSLRTTRDARAFVDRVLARPSPIAPLLAHVIRAQAASPAIADVLADLHVHGGVPASDLRGLTVPVTMMWGRDDRLLSPAAFAFFRGNLPAHATIVEPDGIGHCPHLDAPGHLARALTNFAAAEMSALR